MAEMNTKLIPANVEAEQAVLGSILIDPGAMSHVVDLAADDFYDSRHRLIYEAMWALWRDGAVIDPITIMDRLSDRADRAGGIAYLAELANACPTPAHVEYYANMVRTAATKRQLVRFAERIGKIAYSDEDDVVQAALQAARTAFARILRLQRVELTTTRQPSTGIPELDQALKLAQWICIADASMTANMDLAMRIARFAASSGQRVAILSHRSPRQIGARLVMLELETTADEDQARQRVAQMPIAYGIPESWPVIECDLVILEDPDGDLVTSNLAHLTPATLLVLRREPDYLADATLHVAYGVQDEIQIDVYIAGKVTTICLRQEHRSSWTPGARHETSQHGDHVWGIARRTAVR